MSFDAFADFRMNGHVAIVTGGAQNIGAAVARTFSGAGAQVVIADIPGLIEGAAGGAGLVQFLADDRHMGRIATLAAHVGHPTESARLGIAHSTLQLEPPPPAPGPARPGAEQPAGPQGH